MIESNVYFVILSYFATQENSKAAITVIRADGSLGIVDEDPIHVADVEIMTKQTAAEHPEVLAHLESMIVSSNSKQRNSIEETNAVQHGDSSQETNDVQQSNQIKKKTIININLIIENLTIKYRFPTKRAE